MSQPAAVAPTTTAEAAAELGHTCTPPPSGPPRRGGVCEVCGRTEAAATPQEPSDQVVVDAGAPDELATGVRVVYDTFGDGEELGVEDDLLTVVFDHVAYNSWTATSSPTPACWR